MCACSEMVSIGLVYEGWFGCAKKNDEMQKFEMGNARFNDDACGQSKSSQLQPCHRTAPDPDMQIPIYSRRLPRTWHSLSRPTLDNIHSPITPCKLSPIIQQNTRPRTGHKLVRSEVDFCRFLATLYILIASSCSV